MGVKGKSYRVNEGVNDTTLGRFVQRNAVDRPMRRRPRVVVGLAAALRTRHLTRHSFVAPAAATLGIAEDQALPNPVTGAAVALPEISFFKRENNFAVSKVALVAYQAKSREHIFSSSTLLGGAYDRHFQFLGMIRLRFTDVPELRAIKQLKRRYR